MFTIEDLSYDIVHFEGEPMDYVLDLLGALPLIGAGLKKTKYGAKFLRYLKGSIDDIVSIKTVKWINKIAFEANYSNYTYTAKRFTGSKNIVLSEFTYQMVYVRPSQNGDKLNIIDSNTGKTIGQFIFDEYSTEKWLIGGE